MRRLISLLFLFCAVVARGQTRFLAATGNVADVQTAYNLAQASSSFTQPNVVLIPDGVWIWTVKLNLSNNIVITPLHSGACEIIDNLTLNNSDIGVLDFEHPSFSPNPIQFFGFSNLWIHTISGGSHRIVKGGFGASGNDSPPHPPVNPQSLTEIVHITGCLFDGNFSTALRLEGRVLGCIDHNQFSPSGAATGISILGGGDYEWDVRPPSWGDTNKLYIEKNGFYWTPAAANANGAVDSYNGARWCARFNNPTNIQIGCHGTDSTGTDRSTHSYEVYSNAFYNTSTASVLYLDFRGGTGPIFGNTFTGANIQHTIVILNYRATYTNVYGSANPPCCNPWGPITGFNPYDANTDVYGNRPLDSIGATSPTDWTHFNDVVAPNGNPNGYVIQASQPAYEWLNTNLTDHVNVQFLVGNNYPNTGSSPQISTAAQVIVQGRDYFNDTPMPGYTPLPFPHPLDTSGGMPTPPAGISIVGSPTGIPITFSTNGILITTP